MKKLISKTSIKITLGLVTLLIIFSLFEANSLIEKSAKGKLYSSSDSIPHSKVGLLLGTGKFLANKHINPYYRNRIAAAERLIKAGKIDYLIISGDNSRRNYNEPMDMKSDLAALGIDTSKVYLDYAGFRTLDSMIRLKEIFGQDSVTVISQPFHNKRAIYIAERQGIFALGFNAKDIPENLGLKTNIREKFARVKVFVDLIFNTQPKFLGEKVLIPSN